MPYSPNTTGDTLSLATLMLVICEATDPAPPGELTFDANRIATAIINAVTPDTRAQLPHDLHAAVRDALDAAPAHPQDISPLRCMGPVIAAATHAAQVLFDAFEPLRQPDAFTPRPATVRGPLTQAPGGTA